MIKGFIINAKKTNGYLILNSDFNIELIEEIEKTKTMVTHSENKPCPKCKQGTLIKGKTAFGCNRYKEGCDFRQPF